MADSDISTLKEDLRESLKEESKKNSMRQDGAQDKPGSKDLLIEIGTEELPPKALLELAKAFTQCIDNGLAKAGLKGTDLKTFATPRRLGVMIRNVPSFQPDHRQERRGPAIKAAFDINGVPTKAAEGFARSCGITVAELQRIETEKGTWLAYLHTEPGAPAQKVIPKVIEAALAELPVPRRMRWGNRDNEFVRPVHWATLLFGAEVIPMTLLGVKTGRESRGHRFHHPQPLYLSEPRAYQSLLETEGKVIVDFDERREAIRAQAEAAAASVGGQALINDDLLQEVTALVEWPVAILGNFEQRFLQVPPEVLITTMQDNQKYFPVVDAQGKLMPHFVTISNIESREPAQVQTGNERVIRPRFRDAEFFWEQDRRYSLASHQESLKAVVFQQKLGSLYDKCERIEILARFIAQSSDGRPDWAGRAARLSKCDLLTHMVQEFPNLQGIMGCYYAGHDGEPDEVARALEEQYRPRFAGDDIPTTATGRALALADRLDTLVGIFAIGQAPSGTKDPFALRRAGLGVLRIMIEAGLPLDLSAILERAAQAFAAEIGADKTIDVVFDFIMDRLRGYYLEQGFRPDVFDAVLDRRPSYPLDFDRRIRALTTFRERPEANSLTAANKRIRNILRQVQGPLPFDVRPDLLHEDAERRLAGRLTALASEVVPLIDSGFFSDALTRLAGLKDPIDDFFDEVMVMVEDPNLRGNRLALLNELESLFLRIANLSLLQQQN